MYMSENATIMCVEREELHNYSICAQALHSIITLSGAGARMGVPYVGGNLFTMMP